MENDVQLISDGDGFAFIGSRTDIRRHLTSMGLLSSAKEIKLPRLGALFHAGAAAAQAGSEIAPNSAYWLKLTKESAQRVKESGLMDTKTPGVSYAMVGNPGAIESWLKIAKGPGSFLTNPATLTGIAGMMAQLARQQEMGEIKSYLATIDRKVDDVSRALKDAELGKVSGAGSDIEDAMAVLEQGLKIDDDTWSTVQARTHTISDALGWAQNRLTALTQRLESTTKVGELAAMAREAESEVQVWLAVVARCFELKDALDVLRLERVLDSSPHELDKRRLLLQDARQQRRDRILKTIEHLVTRMDAAASRTTSNVLLHLSAHRASVNSINHVGTALDDFYGLLGIESGRQPLEATRWWDAARDSTQWENAAAEAGPKAAAVGAGVVALGTVGIVVSRATPAREDRGEEE